MSNIPIYFNLIQKLLNSRESAAVGLLYHVEAVCSPEGFCSYPPTKFHYSFRENHFLTTPP